MVVPVVLEELCCAAYDPKIADGFPEEYCQEVTASDCLLLLDVSCFDLCLSHGLKLEPLLLFCCLALAAVGVDNVYWC